MLKTYNSAQDETMSIKKQIFGKLSDGTEVEIFTLTNRNGLEARVMTYGAILVSMKTGDSKGNLADIVLGFDTLTDYVEKNDPYFGTTTGRFANRIAKGRFTLDGVEYTLAQNNGNNHLHGGINGFNKVIWSAKEIETGDAQAVEFTYLSPNGEEGYPGNLSCSVIYKLTDNDELSFEYTATTDKPTVVNLTNHAYWNLAGHDSGDVLDHQLQINADNYTPVDDGSIPTGVLANVAGTVMDFTGSHSIGEMIDQIPGDPGGYDHNYVLNAGDELSLAATVHDPTSGRVMEVSTTEPGIQFYTANYLDGSITGKSGAAYNKRGALCLETQHFPDSPNQPDFPSTVLRPGETYKHLTVHKFSIK